MPKPNENFEKDAAYIQGRLQNGGISPNDKQVEKRMAAMEEGSNRMLQQAEQNLDASFSALDGVLQSSDMMQQRFAGMASGVDSDAVENLLNEVAAERVSNLPKPGAGKVSAKATPVQQRSTVSVFGEDDEDAAVADIVNEARDWAEMEEAEQLRQALPSVPTEAPRAKKAENTAAITGASAFAAASEPTNGAGRKPVGPTAGTVTSTSVAPKKANAVSQPKTKVERLHAQLAKQKTASQQRLARGWENVAKVEATTEALQKLQREQVKQEKRQGRLEARVEREGGILAAILAFFRKVAEFFTGKKTGDFEDHLNPVEMQRTFGGVETPAPTAKESSTTYIKQELHSDVTQSIYPVLEEDDQFEVTANSKAAAMEDQRSELLRDLQNDVGMEHDESHDAHNHMSPGR